MPRPHLALLAALVASALVLALSGFMNAALLTIAALVGINVILAVSLNLVNGHTGQFSLGHAGFMAIGAWISAVMPMPVADGGEWLFQSGRLFAALAAGGLAAAASGLLIGLPCLNLRGDHFALVTLGFAEIIRQILQAIGPDSGSVAITGLPAGIQLFWVLVIAAFTVFTVSCLVRSTYGRGFLATRDDETAAEMIGLDTRRYKLIAFTVGAFFAGIAGGLLMQTGLASGPGDFAFTRSIEIVAMVILGGAGSTLGVILAAIVLTLAPELIPALGDHRMILYALVLVVLMRVRPEGFFQFRPGPAHR